jgi:metal-responsive CopG/Arc/MetJ family transcriptional regulator
MTIESKETVKKGRPVKDKSKDGQIFLRLESDLLLQLDNIVNLERDKTGFNISRSDIVRKAIIDLIKHYSI